MNMPLQKNRLGRGLASLIGETPLVSQVISSSGEHRTLGLDQLRGGKLNPRKDFREEDLVELADSIKAKGLVQPLIVRPDPDNNKMFEIVAGERRWRAAQKAGLHKLPAIVRNLSDQEVLEFGIIENVQRSDLNAIEEAVGYKDLIERFAYSQDQVSEIIGKSRSYIANTLRLLKLPISVQDFVQKGVLSAGHARALVGREDAAEIAKKIIEFNLNVRDVEALVQADDKKDKINSKKKSRNKDTDTRAFEKELSNTLGLSVEIKKGAKESGSLIIKFNTFDQLEDLRLRLSQSTSGN
ncbi:MAG: ParB/RepB/Spo0J family partition protein [Hyphomicrobium sp.]